MKKLFVVLLILFLTVPLAAAELKGVHPSPGVVTDDLVFRPQIDDKQFELVTGGQSLDLKQDNVPLPAEPVVITDSEGKTISLERTNQLIELKGKYEQEILALREHISYLDVIVDKRNQERKDSELMYLKLRRAVELAQQQVK